MEFISEELLQYCEEHSTAESEVLKELNRNTYAKVLSPRMLSGHLQGRFLSMISRMIKPKNILEIGTYTGYSGICLAEGLAINGKITTIDINDELNEMTCQYFNNAGIKNKSEIIIGDARQIIPNLNEKFDLIFIDADKESYSTYYDLVFEKLTIGGYIIADNVLWSGNVLKEEKNWDRDTKWIVAFNEKVNTDERTNKVLLPLRDGLYLIERIK